MTEPEIAWLAGLFEGEGTAGVYGSSVQCIITSTDQDVIDHVQELFPANKIYYVKRRQPQHKEAWCWRIQDRPRVTRFLELILPYLGERRSAKAREVLTHIEAHTKPTLEVQ